MYSSFQSLPRLGATKRAFTSSSVFQGLLTGKKCIITGASRGIGAEIARRFAAEGASCILIGRNEQLLDELKMGLKPSVEGEGHRVIVGDVGKEEFWKGLRGEVCLCQLGRPQVLGGTRFKDLIVITEKD